MSNRRYRFWCAATLTLGLAVDAAAAPQITTDTRAVAPGWRLDPDGAWHGTGKNFGRGWRQNPDGTWRGTGDNFGKGWREDPDGTWRGTGENFGRGWRQTR